MLHFVAVIDFLLPLAHGRSIRSNLDTLATNKEETYGHTYTHSIIHNAHNSFIIALSFILIVILCRISFVFCCDDGMTDLIIAAMFAFC